jgi:putative endonuclease
LRDLPSKAAGFLHLAAGTFHAWLPGVHTKRTVYVIQSESKPTEHYVGLTSDVVRRLAAHNAGESHHTRKWRPWSLAVAVEFAAKERATEFERYLKSGSGRAFLKRHFL